MANVTFRKGLEENLPTDGMAEEGCVYHATDSGNAYIGSSNGSLIPLNRSPYYGTSSTVSSTNSKVVTLDTEVFSLYEGVMITVRFENANTASSPTINVNGTGAIAVKLYGTTAAGNTPAKSWNAGEAVTFVYDGSYWLLVGGGTTGVTDYDDLDDKPQINGVTLSGNKTSSQLGLQSELTFDNVPTANSNNPVKSGGVKTALDAKQDTLVNGTNIKTVNNTSLLGSGNIQINDGVGFQTITTQQDGTVQITLTNGDTITVDLNHVHPQYYSKVMESVMPQGGFLPDVVYSLGVLSSNITFALAPAVVGNTNHYYWTFSTATTAITVTWPTNLIWANGNVPTIAANKHYEISILDSIAVYMETSIQEND